MKSITEYVKNKIRQVRLGQLYVPGEDTPVNMTRILSNPHNILIIPYNRMGTVLLATRVFKSFRERFSSAKISVAVYNPWSVLIQNDPTVDEIITFGDQIENPFSK